MSNAAIKWAMSQKAGDPTRKLILILLADFANSSAECWPSVATISQASEITARSVQRAIRGLETSGLIVAMPRSGNSTKYRLNVGATPDTSVTPDVGVTPDASVRGGATWVSGGG